MKFPVCHLWVMSVKKYKTTLPFRKLSRDFSLSYSKVQAYGYNTFKKLDMDFIKKLCEIFDCKLEEILTDNKEEYLRLRGPEKPKEIKIKPSGPVVYFVKNEDGLTKIGRTNNLNQRLMSLKYDPRGKGLQLIHYIQSKDINVLEKTLHKAFADKRIEGEWFDLSDKDIANLKG